MAENTNIEWCDHTFNFVRGCRKKSAGCTNCYAETMSGRNPAVLGEWGPNAKRVFAVESYWKQLKRWDRQAKAEGRIARVFVASLADVFEGEPLPGGKEGTDGPRADYLPHLERLAKETSELQNLRILTLTKRPENMLAWFRARGEWPWSWWAGTSVEHQGAANDRVPLLCQVPALVRFLSMEPLLGPVDVGHWLQLPAPSAMLHADPLAACLLAESFRTGRGDGRRALDWVIVGGESGSKARPMHPDWVRFIRDQCVDAGVPLLLKQWGRWSPACNHSPGVQPPGAFGRPLHVDAGDCIADNAERMYALGKKAAGRELDGRTWDQVPEEAPSSFQNGKSSPEGQEVTCG